MLSAFVNSLKIPDLRSRIFFTFGVVFLCRILAMIPAPGVNPKALEQFFEKAGGIFQMFNLFTGGGLSQFAIGGLGIMPYISASIILQLLTAVVPTLQKLSREGDVGRQKITQYTKYLTLGLCIVQSALLMNVFGGATIQGPISESPFPVDFFSRLVIVLTMTTGSMLLVWMGEQITDRGIGNGVSLIITISIISSLPTAITTMWGMFVPKGDIAAPFSPFHLAALLAFFFIVTAATVALTQAVRRVPVTHAKRVVGRKVYGGQTTHFPIRVNYSGVMPIIFAQAILMFPQPFLANFLGEKMKMEWATQASYLFGYDTKTYLFIYILMIMFFSYFWVATQFKPIELAEQLKKEGGYIPGIRPGKSTAEFLDRTMTRLTLAGAIGLTMLAVIPMIITNKFGIPMIVSQFLGGTSLLIIVGVMLDTMRQIESHLLNRHYDGFLRKGKLAAGRR